MTTPGGSPLDPDDKVELSLKDLMDLAAESGAKAARAEDADDRKALVREALKEAGLVRETRDGKLVPVNSGPAKGTEEYKRQLDRRLHRLADLYEKLYERCEDDMEKADQAVEELEAVLKKLSIKLPPRRSGSTAATKGDKTAEAKKDESKDDAKKAGSKAKDAAKKFGAWLTAKPEKDESAKGHH